MGVSLQPIMLTQSVFQIFPRKLSIIGYEALN